MALSVPLYTVEDLKKFPHDGNRYELLDGVLLVTPAPSLAHQIVVSRVQHALATALQMPGYAYVVGPGVVVRKPRTQLEPDVLVFPTRFAPTTDWFRINEHWLAIEVLSPSSRVYDREFKRDAYFALGARQVWLVDRWNKFVEVSRAPGPGRRVRTTIRWSVPTLRTIVAIDLRQIFAGLP